MHEIRHVRIYYCTREVRSLLAALPLDGLLRQGAKTLSASEFGYLKAQLEQGRRAIIDGPECWFEYEVASADAA